MSSNIESRLKKAEEKVGRTESRFPPLSECPLQPLLGLVFNVVALRPEVAGYFQPELARRVGEKEAAAIVVEVERIARAWLDAGGDDKTKVEFSTRFQNCAKEILGIIPKRSSPNTVDVAEVEKETPKVGDIRKE